MYKVGEKIKIKSDLVTGQKYGTCYLWTGMKEVLCGNTFTVTFIHEDSGYLDVKETGLIISFEMIDDEFKIGDKVISTNKEYGVGTVYHIYPEYISVKFKYQILGRCYNISDHKRNITSLGNDTISRYVEEDKVAVVMMYKVGDSVVFKSDLVAYERYGTITAIPGMCKPNTVMVIDRIDLHDFTYHTAQGFWINDAMIDGFSGKFKVGDLIKGTANSIYGVTDETMTKGKVIDAFSDGKIRVEILESSRDCSAVGMTFPVDSKYFEAYVPESLDINLVFVTFGHGTEQYTFEVPQGVVLREGDKVFVPTARCAKTPVTCSTDSFIITKVAAEKLVKGLDATPLKKVIGKAVSKTTYEVEAF